MLIMEIKCLLNKKKIITISKLLHIFRNKNDFLYLIKFFFLDVIDY